MSSWSLAIMLVLLQDLTPFRLGVQIKVVFYDKTGDIRKVEDMWPASVNNIEPHSSFPFEVMIDKVNDFETVEASIIQVTAW